MDFVPYRELRNEPAALRKKLEQQGELVVTVDGKPFAVMVDLQDGASLEDLMKLISRFRAQRAVRQIRSAARKEGLDKLSNEKIDTLIEKTRTE
jgi:antitoxin (DNA-binding transcriptional repressor) of toxin-antitoxin stability system